MCIIPRKISLDPIKHHAPRRDHHALVGAIGPGAAWGLGAAGGGVEAEDPHRPRDSSERGKRKYEWHLPEGRSDDDDGPVTTEGWDVV